jgi:hypothetical protein
LSIFAGKYQQARQLIVGEGGIPLTEFLTYPAQYWLE